MWVESLRVRGLIVSGIEGTDDIEQHKQSPEDRNAWKRIIVKLEQWIVGQIGKELLIFFPVKNEEVLKDLEKEIDMFKTVFQEN